MPKIADSRAGMGECAAEGVSRQHMAILHKRYLDMVVSGEKSLEFRLTRVCVAPFGRASAGEVVWLKQSGGPYRARAVIEAVLFVQLGPHWPLARLRERFGEEIRATEAFWAQKAGARYASLLWLGAVEEIAREDVPGEVLGLPVSRSAWRVVETPGVEAGAVSASR